MAELTDGVEAAAAVQGWHHDSHWARGAQRPPFVPPDDATDSENQQNTRQHQQGHHEDGVRRGVSAVKMFQNVSHQSHNNHRINSHNVSHPTVQHPVLKNEPGHDLCEQDAQRGCSGRGSSHAPQLENQSKVNERRDGRPCGVQGQTVLDQESETAQVFAVVRLQPEAIVICGPAAEEQDAVVGESNENEDHHRCQHQLSVPQHQPYHIQQHVGQPAEIEGVRQ